MGKRGQGVLQREQRICYARKERDKPDKINLRDAMTRTLPILSLKPALQIRL